MTIANTPPPPYYAAIFSSVRATDNDPDYMATAQRIAMLATKQPGFLGFEFAAPTPEHFSLFISYWKSDADIRAWKQVAEHQEAQRLGNESWYARHRIRIAKVERDYGKDG